MGDAKEVTEDVKRRNFINAVAGAVVWGHPVVRELLTAPSGAAAPLPQSLGAVDVASLRDLTEQMRLLARQYGGQADTTSATAQRYARLMDVPATETVRSGLGSALAELHTVAGWACHDAMTPDAARYHFGRAIELAQHAGDAYQQADALYHAGAAFEESGGPNEALKLLQMGQVRLFDARDHPRSVVLGSWFSMDSARAYATMGYTDQARSALVRARENWEPADVFDKADFDHVTAMVYRDLGKIDSAQALATTSARTWTAEQRREGVLNDITLADLYLSAGEPAGVRLAAKAIDGAAELQSARARDHLMPLVAALGRRKDSTAQDLVRQVRQLQRV